MADVAVKSFEFPLVVVYAPIIAVEKVSLFRRLAPFLDDSKRLVFMGDWNAILDPKISRASGLGRFESSLVDFMARHDLDHPGTKMLT